MPLSLSQVRRHSQSHKRKASVSIQGPNQPPSSPSSSSAQRPRPGSRPQLSGIFAGSSNVDARHGNFTDASTSTSTGANVTVAGNLHINVESQTSGQLLEKVPCAKGAGFRSGNHERCLEGTRKAELQRIEQWLIDYTARLIYWLGGVAGTGKSTIAQTIAERCSASGRIVVTFFCSRDFAERRNIRLIFPTLAYHLASHSPEFRAALIRILGESADVSSYSLEVQFTDLIIRPLLEAKIYPTIIIDALDECEDDEPASAILSVMARHIDEISFVKFFVTGRPERPIRQGFRLQSLRPHTEVFMLHEVDRTMVDEDIELYLMTCLSEIGAERCYDDSPIAWPSKDEITAATKKCGGLFIVAYVIVKFVGSRRHKPRERLRILINNPDDTVHEGKSGVDKTYDKVILHGFDDIDSEDVDFFGQLRIVIGSVVLAFDPLSCVSLATILCITLEDVQIAFDSLYSIFIIPDSKLEPIRVCHKSLADYLTDQSRCTDSRFYINPPVVHLELGLHSLRLLNMSLKRNICNLPRFALNADIRDLDARRETYIGSGLEYACRSWANHLRLALRSGDDVGHVVKALDEFFNHHLLQWLEVLSIVGDLGCAVYSFRDVKTWLVDVMSLDARLLAIVEDSEKFVVRFFEVIESSATHIYESALPLSPLSSLVRYLYRDQMMSTDVKIHGIDQSWDACVREIQSSVASAAFSYRDDLIVVGTQKGTVAIFHAITGQCRTTFVLPANSTARSLMFSPDDTILVTGCDDGRVSVLDLQTGGIIDTLEGHTSNITSVVFSPCGSMIATSSRDSTIRIWNSTPLDCRCVLEGHFGAVNAVCWSATGNEVISGSKDTTVKIWSVSGMNCTRTMTIHTDIVLTVASSPDSSLIASGSEDGTIKVSDAQTGDAIHTISMEDICLIRFLDRGRLVYTGGSTLVIRDITRSFDVSTSEYHGQPFAISSDGSRLVSSDGIVVKIWQTNILKKDRGTDDHHTNKVWCISLSKDGQLVATGSWDKTVKVWDTSTGQCLTTFRGHLKAVTRMLISPDSSVCASATLDHIAIWDVHSGSLVSTLVLSYYFNDMCFSPDGSQVATLEVKWSYPDLTWLKLWEVRTGKCLASMNVPEQPDEISFDVDGASVTLRKFDKSTERWGISSAPMPITCDHESPTDDTAIIIPSLPMDFVRIDDMMPPLFADPSPMPHQSYRYDRRSSWIVDKRERRTLWVLPDWRANKGHFYGNKFIFTTSSHMVIIVEFSAVEQILSTACE